MTHMKRFSLLILVLAPVFGCALDDSSPVGKADGGGGGSTPMGSGGAAGKGGSGTAGSGGRGSNGGNAGVGGGGGMAGTAGGKGGAGGTSEPGGASDRAARPACPMLRTTAPAPTWASTWAYPKPPLAPATLSSSTAPPTPPRGASSENDFTLEAWIKAGGQSLTGTQFWNGNGLIYSESRGRGR